MRTSNGPGGSGSGEHVLDTLPLDFTQPAVRELHRILTTIYFRSDRVVSLVLEVGLPPATIAWDASMSEVWYEILRKGRDADRLWALLDRIAADPLAAAYRARLGELMQAEPIVEASARSSEPPEWLGFEDGGIERIIAERSTLVGIAFLEQGVRVARSVVRLTVTVGHRSSYGTAFRVGPDALLTNHHVLFDEDNDDESPSAVEAWLAYELDVTGVDRHRVVRCDPASVVGNREHDWGVVRVAEALPDDCPILPLALAAEPGGEFGAETRLNVDDRVFIIQHPDGGPKQIGVGNNIVRHVDDEVIQYFSDTEAGSSGSPVFDIGWRVVGLHQKWVEAKRGLGRREYRNQGRTIGRVSEGLRNAGVL